MNLHVPLPRMSIAAKVRKVEILDETIAGFLARVPQTDETCKAVALLSATRNKLIWGELQAIEAATEAREGTA